MHDNKLISAAVVLVVASVAWFIPAPEGLCRTSVYGEVTVRANKIAFDEKKKLRVGKVAELLSDTPPPRSDDQPTQHSGKRLQWLMKRSRPATMLRRPRSNWDNGPGDCS